MINVQVIGAKKVAAAFSKEIRRFAGNPKCEVGTGTKYGVYVHEHTWKAHKPPTEAKFMERALDQVRLGYAKRIAALVKKHASHRKPLHMALYAMGLIVDGDMVKRIPVKTGRLRASHYVAPPLGISGGGQAPTKPGKG